MNWISTATLSAALSIPLVAIGLAEGVLPGSAASQGKQVFDQWCADCHAPVSAHRELVPGTYALQEIYKGRKPAALEQRTDLTQAYVKIMVRVGRNVMPPTRKTEISDQQLDALAAYLAHGH
jgi:mono/diheme cytochrome c family protein